MKTAMVVPTNREDSLDVFLQMWSPWPWDDLIIVEDNPEPTFKVPADCQHYAWNHIDEDLGDAAWIISRRSSAIRSYGFYKAWQSGAEVILTLDDDCYPFGEDGRDQHVEQHLNNLLSTPRWISTVPYVIVRGLPYELGEDGMAENVAASMGLWCGIGDVDAVQTLAGQVEQPFNPYSYDRMMSPFQYFPMCGMNLSFHQALMPAMLFAPSGKDQPYDRFDDIWCGIILQKIGQRLGFGITVGHPVIQHARASNPLANLQKEAPGMQANVLFWKLVDRIDISNATDLRGAIICIGHALRRYTEEQVPDEELRSYLRNYGQALTIWGELFNEESRAPGGDGQESAVDDDARSDSEQPAEMGD